MLRMPKVVQPGLLLLQVLTCGRCRSLRQPLPRPHVRPRLVELAFTLLLADGRDLLLSRLVGVALDRGAQLKLGIVRQRIQLGCVIGVCRKVSYGSF